MLSVQKILNSLLYYISVSSINLVNDLADIDLSDA